MVKKALILLLLGFSALVAITFFRNNSTSDGTRAATQSFAPSLTGKIVYASAGALWLYQDGKQQQLTDGPRDRQDKRDAMPSLSPDGADLVYTRFDEGYSDIYKMSISDPTGTSPITSNKPDVEVGKVGINGEPGYANLALWALYPTWSPSGVRIAYTSDVGTQYPGLYTMDPNGDAVRKLSTGLDYSQQTVEHPSYSPDGGKLAVTNYLTRNGKAQVWVLDLETSRWTELTDTPDGAYDPAWSPNGEWIAFAMREGTAHNIYVVPTDAEKWTDAHPTPIKLTTDGASRAPTWSPDGTQLAYLSLKSASFDIHVADFIPGETGSPHLTNEAQLTENANIDADSGLTWGQ